MTDALPRPDGALNAEAEARAGGAPGTPRPARGTPVAPPAMGGMGKRFGRRRGAILPMVNVARAFTCYQMASLVLDVARRKVEDTGAGLLILSCFPALYLDEDVPPIEALDLF